MLHYDVKADVGGKIAQLGARLIDATARKLAGEFFSKLSALVAAEPSELNVIIQSEAIVPHRLSWLSRLRNWLFHRGRQVK